MHCKVYPIFVKFVRLTHSNKELLTYLLISSHYKDMKGDTKCRKWGGLGELG